MTSHPSLPHITLALDALYSALGDLREGPHEYRSERSQVEELITTLRVIADDIRTLDRDLSSEGREDARAWELEARAYAGGVRFWGGL